ncbi:MAG: hypothetical protein PHP00_02660 [Thiotrichaceae bacterium]|nr:hypothetical protein [Thiotrichaceae bacterium]
MPKNPPKSALPQISLEWEVIRAAFLWLSGGLLLAVALWMGSREYLRYILQWDNQQHQTINSLQKELASVKEALAIVNTDYYSDFQKFNKNGFFKSTDIPIEEQRLAALEQINEHVEAIASKLRIPYKNHSLAERLNYELPSEFSLPDKLKIYSAQLNLELGMLHEDDLLNFISQLNQQSPPGLFNWQHCELQRKPEFNFKDVQHVNISAVCKLQWYTALEIPTP